MKDRLRILCMTDLTQVPRARPIIEAVGDVDYMPADRQILLDRIGDYDAFWGHIQTKVDKEVLQRASRLKVINVAATGTDHIDKEEAARRGIKILCIANDIGLLDTFTATAEIAWLLALACYRNFRGATRSVQEGCWEGALFTGRQLSGETLGVLGVGRLGKMTLEFGKSFRMRVLGCDRKPFDIHGVKSVDIGTLFRESDLVSIHIHLTPENHHLIDRRRLESMKKGAVIVNTSRADIIAEDALIDALDSGQLSAYGTDVIHDEWRADLSTSRILQYARTHENVIVTPHIGGATWKSLIDARMFSAKKLAQYLRDGTELTWS